MRRKNTDLSPALLDSLLNGKKEAHEILGSGGIIKQLTKALLERALEAELTDHLGYEKHEKAINPEVNYRNGVSSKTLKSDDGLLEINVPRDRSGDFTPQLIKKNRWSSI